MGEAIQVRPENNDLEDEDSLLFQVNSREETGELEPEKKPQETKPPQETEQPKELTLEDDKMYVFNGQQILGKDLKAGLMKDADYRQKTSALAQEREDQAAQMLQWKRDLEAIYGPYAYPEAKQEAPKPRVETAIQGEFNPYDVRHMKQLIREAVDETVTPVFSKQQDQQREQLFETKRQEVWTGMVGKYKDLQDKNSELTRLASQIYEADPLLQASPLGDRYAVATALEILGDNVKGTLKSEAVKEIAAKITQRKPAARTPQGSSSGLEIQALTAEERRLVKMEPHEAAALPEKQYKQRLVAMKKARGLRKQ